MSTSYDPYGVPGQRREPLDPLLSLPDHPSGEWATAPRRAPQRIGHPRPARGEVGPYLPSASGNAPYALVAGPAAAPAVLNGRGRTRLFTMLLVLLLIAISGWEAWQLDRVDRRLNTSNAQLTAALHTQTVKGDQLEKGLASMFDPEAVSSNVLPSVFRVRAGNFTGTAFSIGGKAANGQSNLLTNFHVVQSVFDAGVKKVSLERGKTTIDATIVKVDRNQDLALLRANKKIEGLAAATATVKPGQPVVVAGAPLGLDDTVTSGVISAYRPDDPGGAVIQFDAAINPGNSGGPVVNANEEVIGLATAKARDAEGIGLAVPIKTACDTFKGIC
ncbi:MAG TPA: S1C family serine protease [Actinoplanes sp.]|jgi:putative serine protease PepD|nr:S1C family serine protease [Actinoplanes sp.]